jgi:hypothetical protein
LSQIDPIHTIPSYLSQIHFNIVHPPTSWASQWSPKCHKGPRTWADSLDKRPKRKKMDMRFGVSCYYYYYYYYFTEIGC